MTDLPILIADDDESVVASLRLMLKQAGFTSVIANTADQAVSIARSQPLSAVLQDMNFSRSTSGEEGLTLLENLKSIQPEVPIILITAWGNIDLAVAGMKRGASDFVAKPWDNAQLLKRVRTAMALTREAGKCRSTRDELDRDGQFQPIVGSHPDLLAVLDTVMRVARTDATVLILGESGTGKELVANAVHENSDRAASEMVRVNLGGIPVSLFESEMFGHVKGAFTDARSDRVGYFEAADGGTLFLDEVGELDKASQVKLLRALEDRSYQRVGSSQRRTSDVRIVAATNRDLESMVACGEFREDLYYRLNLISVTLPPLRDRLSDVAALSDHIIKTVCARYGRPAMGLAADGLALLRRQPWAGNVRQLRQTIERAILMTRNDQITASDLRLKSATGSNTDLFGVGTDATLEEMERLMIERKLAEHDGNVSQTAQSLGLSRPALYRRLEKFGLDTEPNPDTG